MGVAGEQAADVLGVLLQDALSEALVVAATEEGPCECDLAQACRAVLDGALCRNGGQCMPLHAGLPQEPGQGRGRGRVSKPLESLGHCTVVGERDARVEQIALPQDGWGGATIAGVAEGQDNTVDRGRQIGVVGHLALEDLGIPLGDCVQRRQERG